MKYRWLPVAVLVLAAGCSSGPSKAQQMAAWYQSPGGQTLSHIGKDVLAIVPLEQSGQFSAIGVDGVILSALAKQAEQQSPPPVDAAQYKQMLADVHSAGVDLAPLLSPTESTAAMDSAVTAAAHELGAAQGTPWGSKLVS
jgi:hypothetical protein